EGQPRDLDGGAGPGEAEQRPGPDRQRGDGDGVQRPGGPFASRVGRQPAFPRRSDSVPPPSHVARLRASRQRSLFEPRTDDSPPVPSAPPGAINDGTLLSPPGRASGNPVPPEGLPQVSAGTVAARAEPRAGAESG